MQVEARILQAKISILLVSSKLLENLANISGHKFSHFDKKSFEKINFPTAYLG